jgi:biopolymer transport protein ExbB
LVDALLQSFGGPGAAFMYAITAILAFGLAITFERTWVFWFKWKVDEGQVLSLVHSGQIELANSSAGGHPMARLLKAGAGSKTTESAWDAMASEAALVEVDIRQRVPYLATVGNISTMLGLLGTVYGLIIAFQGLSDSSAVERTTRLSEGIATAMSTTAWGLLVGIPALFIHAVLEGKAARILAICEAAAAALAAGRRAADAS